MLVRLKCNRPAKQRGIALIVVLLMMAIIAALAIQMTSRTQFAVARNINLNSYNQAYWFALSAESMAIRLLALDLKSSGKKTHLQQQWANFRKKPLPLPFESQGVNMLIRVDDLQSYFNVNVLHQDSKSSAGDAVTSRISSNTQNSAISLSVAKKLYLDLLIAAGLEEHEAERLRDIVVDYIDDDQDQSSMGAEDENYLAKTLPYITRSGFLNDRSELRAVIGYNQRIYHGFKHYVWALPTNTTKINVNTIDQEHAPLMRALLENQLSLQEAKSLIDKRPPEGWNDFNDFKEDASAFVSSVPNSTSKLVDVLSHYFLLHIEVLIEERVFKLDSVLYYEKDKPIKILNRQFGGQA